MPSSHWFMLMLSFKAQNARLETDEDISRNTDQSVPLAGGYYARKLSDLEHCHYCGISCDRNHNFAETLFLLKLEKPMCP